MIYKYSECGGLTSIAIPSSVTSLGDWCFEGCSSLTSISIPSSVTSLGGYCFKGCSCLETVYFKGKVPGMYSGREIPTACIIKVPTEYLQDYKDAFGENLSNVLKQKEMKPWQCVTVWNSVMQLCRSEFGLKGSLTASWSWTTRLGRWRRRLQKWKNF